MLNYWTIQIRCEKDIEGYNLANAKRIHGFLFETISKYNKELASFHHDKQKKQSFSISTIFNLNDRRLKTFKKNTSLKFYISIYDDKISEFLFEFFKRNRIIPLFDKELIVENISYKSIDKLYLENNKLKKAKLIFISPTTFRINSINYPLPEPKRIFKSLNGSYKEIFNEELLNENDLEKINANVLLKNVDINTEYVEYDKFKVFGFIGNVILEIKFDDKILQEKSEILLALAEFVGLGYKTGMGMGKCLIQKV